MEILAKNLKQREKQAMLTPRNHMQNKNTWRTGLFQGVNTNSAKNSYGKGKEQVVKCTY